jgi:hypothetical protein
MSDYDDLIEGLTILKRYVPASEQYTSAEHDIIYVGGGFEKATLSDEDAAKLDALGFFIDEESGSWATFT